MPYDAFQFIEFNSLSLMPYLIGIDEAGYAPNLGPLLIGGTLWQVPSLDCDLYRLLKKAVSRTPAPPKVAIADSKQLHTPDSLGELETNLWAVCPQFRGMQSKLLSELLREHSPNLSLADLASTVSQASFLWSQTDTLPSLHEQLNDDPGLASQPLTLPLEAAEELGEQSARFAETCQEKGVTLLRVASVPLFPAAFNELSERLGNKSNLLTALSLRLARELLESLPPDSAPVTIYCDKHGGRNRYASAVETYLSPIPPAHECETAELSRYRFTAAAREIRIQFAAGGEAQLPVALASMYAKYLRELCMVAFNRYWQSELPSLEPTKGYPADAKRFREAITPRIEALGWEEHTWWRLR